MKKIKKYVFSVLFFSLLFLTGCAKPEETVEEELTAVGNLDGETISKYLSTQSLFEEADGQALSVDTKEIFDLILKDFKYEIIETQKKGKKATSKVEVTTRNMEPVAKSYLKTALEYLMVNEGSTGGSLSTEQMFTILKETLQEDAEVNTREISITLEKKEKEWSITSGEELADELTGHFAALLDDSYLLPPEDVVQITLDSISQMEPDALKQYLSLTNTLSEDGSVEDILAGKIKQYFSYEITGSEVKGNAGIVNLKITNIDLAASYPRYEKLLAKFIKKQKGVTPSDKKILKAANKYFKQSIEELEETKTFEVTLNLSNDGNIWTMDSNEQFVDAMLGGLTELQESITGAS